MRYVLENSWIIVVKHRMGVGQKETDPQLVHIKYTMIVLMQNTGQRIASYTVDIVINHLYLKCN